MKRILTFILLFILFQYTPFANEGVHHTIHVNGDAEVKVTPDFVVISLGVETFHKKLATAKTLNDNFVKKILKLSSEYSIEKKYFQTDKLFISPRYHNYSDPELVGYNVRKNISITLKKLSLFEEILSKSLKRGATHVHHIQFKTSHLRKYRDQARKNAMIAAKQKAIDLAGALDTKVGKPIRINEGRSYNGSWYNSSWGGHNSSLLQNSTQNVSSGKAYESETTSLGQISISASVSVTFELE